MGFAQNRRKLHLTYILLLKLKDTNIKHFENKILGQYHIYILQFWRLGWEDKNCSKFWFPIADLVPDNLRSWWRIDVKLCKIATNFPFEYLAAAVTSPGSTHSKKFGPWMVSQYQEKQAKSNRVMKFFHWRSHTMKHERARQKGGGEVINRIHHGVSLCLACFPNNKSWLSQQVNCLSIHSVFVFNFNKVDMQVLLLSRLAWRRVREILKEIQKPNKDQCVAISCE